jgi:hypothetical protein
MPVHDLEKTFQDKVDREVKIEPRDWMPANQPACA